MKDLLIALGKRVHDLRAAKGWSQEEFAHVGGLHRTYIGQVERGEKNISFGNLVKLARALGLTLPDLLGSLEDRGTTEVAKTPRRTKTTADRGANPERRLLEIQRAVKRLAHQRTEMDRTVMILEELSTPSGSSRDKPLRGRSKNRG
ncbi:MAG: helix-turn-helix domain-containing protein [Acidobacteriia bacterium]|nr:helix-turn-helix domain-containing protein [Terriglobia bacterium]